MADVSIDFVLHGPRRIVDAPTGNGQRPQTAYYSASVPANSGIRWTLDSNGWAVGYVLTEKETGNG